MTNIIEKITDDIKQARLAGDRILLDNLVTLKSDIMHGLTQKQAVKPQKTINKLIASYKEVQSLLRDSDVKQVYQNKIDLLESYLETGKTQLDSNALQELLNQNTFESIRHWMSFLKTNHEGQYDGKLASTLFNEQHVH